MSCGEGEGEERRGRERKCKLLNLYTVHVSGCACIPTVKKHALISEGVLISPVSEILLLSKTAKFPFLTMDYSPWSSKNSIDRNRLKKFMQVGIDVKCMHTNFGGCGFFGFGDIATFKNGQISLSDHGL